VPADLADAFGRAAERHERTVSQALRLAMREHLAELERHERFARMTDDELREYLTAVDDGRDERPAGGGSR